MLDHIVLASPDLDLAVTEFSDLTGVEPAPGGSHDGLGTANYLVDLGGGRYLEIIGPDPHQPEPAHGRWFGIDGLTGMRIVTWAMRTADIDAVVARARGHGFDPGDPQPMSRRTPSGESLRWQLTFPTLGTSTNGLVPFLIDWGDSPHPTTRSLPLAPLVSWYATHPNVAAVQAQLAAIGAELDVRPGPRAGLVAVIGGQNGPVTLS